MYVFSTCVAKPHVGDGEETTLVHDKVSLDALGLPSRVLLQGIAHSSQVVLADVQTTKIAAGEGEILS